MWLQVKQIILNFGIFHVQNLLEHPVILLEVLGIFQANMNYQYVLYSLQTAPESSAPTPPTAAVVSYKKNLA